MADGEGFEPSDLFPSVTQSQKTVEPEFKCLVFVRVFPTLASGLAQMH
jgi:hypothetical protein